MKTYVLLWKSLGPSDGINPLTTTPPQNSAVLLRTGNLPFVLRWLLFCSKDIAGAAGITALADQEAN